MASVDQETIIQAVRSCSSTFKSQSESLTFEGVRRLLEKEIGLEPFTLDSHKQLIKRLLEEVLSGSKDNDGSEILSKDTNSNPNSEDEAGNAVSKHVEQNENSELQTTDGSNGKEEDKIDGSEQVCLDDADEKSVDCKKASTEINEAVIKEALWKRASYLKANTESLSLGGVRRLIEQDLHLEKKALDSYKAIISSLVDEILAMPNDAVISSKKSNKETKETKKNKEGSKARMTTKKEEILDTAEILEDGDAIEHIDKKSKLSKMKKRRKEDMDNENMKLKKQKKSSDKDANGISRKQGNRKIAGKDADSESLSTKDTDNIRKEEDSGVNKNGTSEDSENDMAAPKRKQGTKHSNANVVYGKQVENLRKIIKACGMTVPPAIYKKAKQVTESKREEYLIEELLSILKKEGLSSNPTEKEIRAVKKRKERAKDLEGIDTTNIISEGRPRRSASNFFSTPPVQYKPPNQKDDDNDNDDDDSKDEESDEENSDDEESVEVSEDEEQDVESE
eukprot:TRINITY_DN9946_c0_g1_i1.p1 TRINITY_DN9946_c0_g1~~TRINITY_DN9946_c0_g1_i1.p1  ORF type:complete len:508 (-),score=176.50 TRINITY_DN9946_c0_g1_i1:362-1885(-)